jgi:hypothetical protein
MTAERALRLVTVEAARTLGLADRVGLSGVKRTQHRWLHSVAADP